MSGASNSNSKNSKSVTIVEPIPTVTIPLSIPVPVPVPVHVKEPFTVVTAPDISMQIQAIFEQNKLGDLKEFVRKRKCLNEFNTVLMYLFHVVQSAGILTTTIAAGYDMKELIWIGVGINIVASLINIFEKTNLSISKHLMKDIEAIRNGTFVDESDVIEPPAPPAKTPLLSGNEKSEE
jgi:hypothetical protein